MTLRLQAYCEANLQSKYDVKIGNLKNITAGWESEIYAFALEHGRQSKRIREELVLRLYSGEGAGEKSAHEFQSIKRLREVGYPVPQVVVWTASGYRRPSSFLGEGGHKLFLDRIWSDLRFAFQAITGATARPAPMISHSARSVCGCSTCSSRWFVCRSSGSDSSRASRTARSYLSGAWWCRGRARGSTTGTACPMWMPF